MYEKSAIDMSRPTTLYIVGVALLMLVSLLVSNLPVLSFSHHYEFVYRAKVCMGLFGAGALFGAIAVQRHTARVREPWRVPQTQVLYPYVLFFFAAFAAIVLSH